MAKFIANVIQLNSGEDVAANLAEIEKYLREAAKQGSQIAFLPENAFLMQDSRNYKYISVEAAIEKCQDLAKELQISILIGSAQIIDAGGKPYNRSLLIDKHGKINASYDKIHLFDVKLKNGEDYKESDRVLAGNQAILADSEFGKIGMTICYDVRFPHLYRKLALEGADFLNIPAAFTYTTGLAHWHVLLRSRAIETGCYIFAAGQCGIHPGNRRTYGHSMIISPWGEIISEASEDTPGIISATIDSDKINEARSMIPSLFNKSVF
ncbi:MAG: carbon-nitrogen hydrolase family protein [Pseudomonadota bacterium]